MINTSTPMITRGQLRYGVQQLMGTMPGGTWVHPLPGRTTATASLLWDVAAYRGVPFAGETPEFTLSELAKALEPPIQTHASVDTVTDQLVSRIRNEKRQQNNREKLRKDLKEKMTEITGQAITFKQLDESLKRIIRGMPANEMPTATQIFEDVNKNREPEYPDGTVVTSKHGYWYRRVKNFANDGWMEFGNTHIRESDYPVRPLTVHKEKDN